MTIRIHPPSPRLTLPDEPFGQRIGNRPLRVFPALALPSLLGAVLTRARGTAGIGERGGIHGGKYTAGTMRAGDAGQGTCAFDAWCLICMVPIRDGDAHTRDAGMQHEPAEMKKDCRTAQFHTKSWSYAFVCPECSNRVRKNVNYLGGRAVLCDGAKTSTAPRRPQWATA